MMKVMKKIARWMKVMRIAVRTELMNIKILKTDKEDSVTADDRFDS